MPARRPASTTSIPPERVTSPTPTDSRGIPAPSHRIERHPKWPASAWRRRAHRAAVRVAWMTALVGLLILSGLGGIALAAISPL